MERRNLIIIAVAVVIGLFAVFLANSWFSGVEQREKRAVAQPESMARIAVASLDLPFGTALTSDNVRLVPWPAGSVPQGAYSEGEAQRLLGAGNVAIRPIAAGEPILLSRISKRAVLSATIPPDMRAVTVPLDAVSGVAGFVTPGDVVDVLLTRKIPGDGASSDDQMTSVVLQSVPVLAVDLRAGEGNTDPAESKTATLQVYPEGAQKLALATQVGRLSLALRNVEDQLPASRRIVTTRDRDLGGGLRISAPREQSAPAKPAFAAAPSAPAAAAAPAAPRRSTGPAMTVVRGTEMTEEEVKRYAS